MNRLMCAAALSAGGALVVLFSARSISGAAAPKIDVNRVIAHVKTLASDDFEGRAPGTAGEKKTIGYLIRQFSAAGVKPGGDPHRAGARSWTQDVPLQQAEIVGPVAVTLNSPKGAKPLRQGDDIAIRATLLPVSHVAIRNAP